MRKSPHEVFYCYYGRELRAVRDRRWKLVFPHEYRSLDGKPAGRDGKPVAYKQLKTKEALYDLKNDVGETNDVAAKHPEIVARLEQRSGKGPRRSGRHTHRPRGKRSATRRQGEARIITYASAASALPKMPQALNLLV